MSRALLSLLILLQGVALAGEAKKRPILIACYPGNDFEIRSQCERVQAYVNDPRKCDSAKAELAPENATAGQWREYVAKKEFPENMLTIVMGHGVDKEESPTQHFLSNGDRGQDTNALLALLSGTPAKDDKPAVPGLLKKPAILLSSCMSGRACNSSYCMMGTCRGNEVTTRIEGTINSAVMEVLQRYCNKTEFDKVAKDGVIGETGWDDAFSCRPDSRLTEEDSFRIRPISLHIAKQLAKIKLEADKKNTDQASINALAETLVKDAETALTTFRGREAAANPNTQARNYRAAIKEVLVTHLGQELADRYEEDGITDYISLAPGESAFREQAKKSIKEKILYAAREAVFKKFLQDHPTSTLRPTQFDLDKIFNEDYTTVARALYQFYLSKGGSGDGKPPTGFRTGPGRNDFSYPTRGDVIKDTDPGMEALLSGTEFSTHAGNPAEEFTRYRLTLPRLTNKPMVCGNTGRSSFAFHPQTQFFQLRYYPDASYQPGGAAENEGGAAATTHAVTAPERK